MTDILIYESGSGGEMLIRNNDIVTVNGYENMPYLANFGGDDFVGDFMLTGDQRHTARTEKTLNEVPLNSAGRIDIENAIAADLAFLEDDVQGTTVEVATTIAAKNRVDAKITISGVAIAMSFNPDSLYLKYALT